MKKKHLRVNIFDGVLHAANVTLSLFTECTEHFHNQLIVPFTPFQKPAKVHWLKVPLIRFSQFAV